MTQFYCQRCENPIKLTDSLQNLNTIQVNLLKNNSRRYLDVDNDTKDDEESLESGDEEDELNPSQFISKDKLDLYNLINPQDHQAIIFQDDLVDHKEVNHMTISTSLTSNSFVMLDNEPPEKESNEHDNSLGPISNRLNTLHKVFDILSTNNEIDHPLCQDCSNIVTDNYKFQFDQSQKEKEYYSNFLKKIQNENEFIKQDEVEIDSKLSMSISQYQNLQKQEIEKLNELKQLEVTKLKLDQQLQELKKEFDTTKKAELNSILNLRNDMMLDLSNNLNKLDQIKSQYSTQLHHLDKLRKFNIYNEIFSISVDDSNKYGTINGFRLGYRVHWSEVNSGFGQVLLLLTFLLKRLCLDLPDYRLIPMGSQSQIIKISPSTNPDEASTVKTVLNLYSSNDFSIGKLFNFNKLDVSMIALLDVVNQIQSKIKTLDNELELPYRISSRNDTIGGKSIRVSSNSEWTDSCKFLLTNLNWMLVYTSVHTKP